MLDKRSYAGLSPGGRGIRSSAAGLGLTTVATFTAGVLVGMVTDAVERAGIQGNGWSLRGNGALIVPFCALPLVLIAMWLVLAWWLQADHRSCIGGVGAGMLAVLLSLLALGLSRALLPLLLLVAFAIALLIALSPGRRGTFGWLMASAVVLPIAAYAGVLAGASIILPR